MAKPTKKTTKTTTKNPTGSTVTKRNTTGVGKQHRSAATGKYVNASTASRTPRTTITERHTAGGVEITDMAALVIRVDRGDSTDPVSGTGVSAALSDEVDEATIDRLVAEAEEGIPEEKLRRRGRPSIGPEASSTYSVRLPDDLVALVDERSAAEGVSRGETMRRALIDYLTQ